jgi:hypothetical protein
LIVNFHVIKTVFEFSMPPFRCCAGSLYLIENKQCKGKFFTTSSILYRNASAKSREKSAIFSLLTFHLTFGILLIRGQDRNSDSAEQENIRRDDPMKCDRHVNIVQVKAPWEVAAIPKLDIFPEMIRPFQLCRDGLMVLTLLYSGLSVSSML